MMIRKLETFIVYVKVNTTQKDVGVLQEAKDKIEQEILRSTKNYSNIELLSIQFTNYFETEHQLLKSYEDYMSFKVEILRSVSEF